MEILLQLINLLIVNHAGGAADHRALNRPADKATIAHLRQGNFIDVAAALGTYLDKPIFRQLDEGLAHRLTRHIETHGDFFLRQRCAVRIRQ